MTIARLQARYLALFAAVALACATIGLATPRQTDAYTWGPWTTRYYAATQRECDASRIAARHFVGPISYYSSSCVIRVRSRNAVIDTWAGWSDRLIQIEAVAPYWSGAWGDVLTVQMHYNGTRVRYSPETLTCRKYAIYFEIKDETCQVFGDNTGKATARVEYFVSFNVAWLGAGADRGGQQSLWADGTKSAVTLWP